MWRVAGAQRANLLACGLVPQLRAIVGAGRGEKTAIGAERDVANLGEVPGLNDDFERLGQRSRGDRAAAQQRAGPQRGGYRRRARSLVHGVVSVVVGASIHGSCRAINPRLPWSGASGHSNTGGVVSYAPMYRNICTIHVLCVAAAAGIPDGGTRGSLVGALTAHRRGARHRRSDDRRPRFPDERDHGRNRAWSRTKSPANRLASRR